MLGKSIRLYTTDLTIPFGSNPSREDNAVSKTVITDLGKPAESWIKAEILGALDKVTIDWVDP